MEQQVFIVGYGQKPLPQIQLFKLEGQPLVELYLILSLYYKT